MKKQRFLFYTGLFITTSSILMLQLLQTRILSAVTWYHLAFLSISTAMLGMTVGSIYVYLKPEKFMKEQFFQNLAWYSIASALTIVFAFAIQIILLPSINSSGILGVLTWVQIVFFMTIPFFFSGIVVALALTRSPFPWGQVYAVDLLGAASGAIFVIGLLNHFSGPQSILWTATFMVLAGLFFTWAHSGAQVIKVKEENVENAENQKARSRISLLWFKSSWQFFVLVVVFALLGIWGEYFFSLNSVKGDSSTSQSLWRDKWNSYSRITAAPPIIATPRLWGPSPKFDKSQWKLPLSDLLIDGLAATELLGLKGNINQAEFLRYDVTNLAYHLPSRDKVAIIGVGGGRDIYSALLFEAKSITGIEVNPTFIDFQLVDDEISSFVGLKQFSNVNLIVDEARSWFARSEDRFDLIQMSLIDTWAATGAGAFSLTENGLYTTDGWKIFLQSLSDDGVFTVSRWYYPQNSDFVDGGRIVSLAMSTLFEMGIKKPRDHIYLATSGIISTIVVSLSGFSEEDLQSLDKAAEELEFVTHLRPNKEIQHADPYLKEMIQVKDMSSLKEYLQKSIWDLTPPDDNRPFFFNQLPYSSLTNLLMVLTESHKGLVSGNIKATRTLLLLFFISLLFVILTVIFPLLRGLRGVSPLLAVGGSAYFMFIGIGFMLVEIAFLQHFSIFLGHPVYSLSVVLFSLILSTGVGSFLSDKISLDSSLSFVIWSLLISGYLLSQSLWLPHLLAENESATLIIRVSLTVLILLPAGILMGFGFPTGMKLVEPIDSKSTPWFWGINGASGTLAASVAVLCSISLGITTTMRLGGICYLFLIPAMFIIRKSSEGSHIDRNKKIVTKFS